MKKLLITTLSLIAISAHAENSMVILTGNCDKIVYMDAAISPDLCLGKVVNMALGNGRNGFTYFTKGEKNSTIVSFFGVGQKQIHTDKNHVIQPIDKVRFAINGKEGDLDAVGSCAFANPYMGKPVRVDCEAKTSRGSFVGRFVSDGSSPDTSAMK